VHSFVCNKLSAHTHTVFDPANFTIDNEW